MKKWSIVLLVFALLSSNVTKAGAQMKEVVEFGINLERLAQLKSILSTLKKGFDIVSKGYGTVKDLSEGNFKLHQVFLDGLLEVSPAVKKYHKIPEIISMQLALIKRAKSDLNVIIREGGFSLQEMNYIKSVHDNLRSQSLQNLDELVNVTTAGKFRMSDEDRLKAIDRIHQDMIEKLNFLFLFGKNSMSLSLEKKKNEMELNRLKALQGIENNKK